MKSIEEENNGDEMGTAVEHSKAASILGKKNSVHTGPVVKKSAELVCEITRVKDDNGQNVFTMRVDSISVSDVIGGEPGIPWLKKFVYEAAEKIFKTR